jgi:hypothetical protein
MIDLFYVSRIEDQRPHLASQSVRISARYIWLVEEHRSDTSCDLLDVENTYCLDVLLMGELILSTLEIETEVVIRAARLKIALKAFDRVQRGKKLILVNLCLTIC